MFIQRAVTSIFIVLLVVGVLFWGSPLVQLAFIALITVLCAWEWLTLIPLIHSISRAAYVFVFLGLSLFAISINCCMWWIFGIIAVTWAVIIAAIIGFPDSQRWWGKRAVVGMLGLLVIPLFLYALVHIYKDYSGGRTLIMYTILLVWAADVGAYLAGKWFGRHKLIPQVSPGKSWEGALGGMVLVLLVAGVGYAYFQPFYTLCWWGAAVLLFVQSVFGDLFISILKRRRQLKDTGRILPGHGGILDRLDSLFAVLPLAAIVYRYCLHV